MAPLPLFKLPEPEIKKVIELLTTTEKCKLLMCSIATGNFIKRFGIGINSYYIIATSEECTLIVHNDSPKFGLYFKRTTVEEDTKWRNVPDQNALQKFTRNPILDLIQASNRFCSIFNINSVGYHLIIDKIDEENVLDVVTKMLDGNYYNKVGIAGDVINVQNLQMIMGLVRLDSSIYVSSSAIPSDFKHENAFKFRSIEYSNSEWALLDDLKSIRNADEIRLGRTRFDYKDLNQFLHFWINSDDDMMRYLSLTIRNESEIDKNVLLEGLNVLLTLRNVHFIKARDNGRRRQLFGKLWVSGGGKNIVFTTFDSAEFDSRITALKTMHF